MDPQVFFREHLHHEFGSGAAAWLLSGGTGYIHLALAMVSTLVSMAIAMKERRCLYRLLTTIRRSAGPCIRVKLCPPRSAWARQVRP